MTALEYFEKGQELRKNKMFGEAEKYQLARPEYTITEWYAKYGDTDDPIDPNELFCSVRIPLRHVGMGQMMAIDREEIKRLAAQSNYPEYGISGRCNYVTVQL